MLPILFNGMKYSLAELYLLRKDIKEEGIIFNMSLLVKHNKKNEYEDDKWNLRR